MIKIKQYINREAIYKNIITIVTLIISIIFFIVVKYENLTVGMSKTFFVIAPTIFEIWNRRIWGLFTSSLVHLDIFHLSYNGFWLIYLGRAINNILTKKSHFFLLLFSSSLGVSFEILISNEVSIGLSGLIYSYLGIIIIYYIKNRQILINIIALSILIILLLLGFFLDKNEAINIANGTHIGGLIAGLIFGIYILSYYKTNGKRLIFISILLIFISITYLPWSEPWQVRKESLKFIKEYRLANEGILKSQHYIGKTLLYIPGRSDEGKLWLEKAASEAHFDSINELAWYFAANPDPSIRDGIKSLKYSLEICNKTNFKDYRYINTLAASYAALGQWNNAIKYQDLAIDTVPYNKIDIKKDYLIRLNLYKTQKHIYD